MQERKMAGIVLLISGILSLTSCGKAGSSVAKTMGRAAAGEAARQGVKYISRELQREPVRETSAVATNPFRGAAYSQPNRYRGQDYYDAYGRPLGFSAYDRRTGQYRYFDPYGNPLR